MVVNLNMLLVLNLSVVVCLLFIGSVLLVCFLTELFFMLVNCFV